MAETPNGASLTTKPSEVPGWIKSLRLYKPGGKVMCVDSPSGESPCHVLQNRAFFLAALMPAAISAALLVLRANSTYVDENKVPLSVLYIGFYFSAAIFLGLSVMEINETAHFTSTSEFLKDPTMHVLPSVLSALGAIVIFTALIMSQTYSNDQTSNWKIYAAPSFYLVAAFLLMVALLISSHPFRGNSRLDLETVTDMHFFRQRSEFTCAKFPVFLLMASLATGGLLLFFRRLGTYDSINKYDQFYMGYIFFVFPLTFWLGSAVRETYQNAKVAKEKKQLGYGMYLLSRPGTHMVIGLSCVIAALFMFAFAADHPSWRNSPVTAASLLLGGMFFVIMGFMLSNRFFGDTANIYCCTKCRMSGKEESSMPMVASREPIDIGDNDGTAETIGK